MGFDPLGQHFTIISRCFLKRGLPIPIRGTVNLEAAKALISPAARSLINHPLLRSLHNGFLGSRKAAGKDDGIVVGFWRSPWL